MYKYTKIAEEKAQQDRTRFVDALIPKEVNLDWTPTSAQKYHMDWAIECLAISLHWVVKFEWNSKHKIPAHRKTMDTLKPKGEFFRQIFLLCESTHARCLGGSPPYANAAEWFIKIVREHVAIIIGGVKQQSEGSKSSSNGNIQQTFTKTGHIEALLKLPQNVKDGIFPFKSHEAMPAFSKLIDEAISIASDSNVFRNQHLLPFCKAWTKEIHSRKGYVIYIYKDGRLHQQKGSGNSEKLISG